MTTPTDAERAALADVDWMALWMEYQRRLAPDLRAIATARAESWAAMWRRQREPLLPLPTEARR